MQSYGRHDLPVPTLATWIARRLHRNLRPWVGKARCVCSLLRKALNPPFRRWFAGRLRCMLFRYLHRWSCQSTWLWEPRGRLRIAMTTVFARRQPVIRNHADGCRWVRVAYKVLWSHNRKVHYYQLVSDLLWPKLDGLVNQVEEVKKALRWSGRRHP